MTASVPTRRRVLALHIVSRGFGFVVLESPTNLVDWGVKATRRDKNRTTLAKVSDLIDRYAPNVLVIEEPGGSSRCSLRVLQLLESVCNLAALRGVRTGGISKEAVREVFLGDEARTKHEIAVVVAQQLPDLAPWLPRYRKPWMSEDYRMAIFDAAALALAYFHSRQTRNRQTTASLSAQAEKDAGT